MTTLVSGVGDAYNCHFLPVAVADLIWPEHGVGSRNSGLPEPTLLNKNVTAPQQCCLPFAVSPDWAHCPAPRCRAQSRRGPAPRSGWSGAAAAASQTSYTGCRARIGASSRTASETGRGRAQWGCAAAGSSPPSPPSLSGPPAWAARGFAARCSPSQSAGSFRRGAEPLVVVESDPN